MNHRTPFRFLLGYLLVLSGATAALAIPGDENWSAEFGPRGTNGEVRVTLESGGNLLVGGEFTMAGDIAANRIAVWDGTSWSTMGDGFDAPVNAILVWNSEIYAGGEFTASGATPVAHLARWTGSAWAEVGGGTDDAVRTLAVFNDKLYAGGWFYSAGAGAGQVSTQGIASWDGANWDNLGADFNFNFSIDDLEVFNGSLHVGGTFPYAGSLDSPHICRYDGTTWFGVGNGLTYSDEFETNPEYAEVYELEVSGSSLMITGSFNQSGYGDPLDGLTLWDGNNWSDAGYFGGSGYVPVMGRAGGAVHIINADGFLLRYGGFGNWINLIYTASSVGGYSSTIGAYGSDLIVGGSFTGFDTRFMDNIVRYDSGLLQSVGDGQGLDNYAYRLLNWNGLLVAGGSFRTAGGVAATNKIAAWDGSVWSTLGAATVLPYFSAIQSMVEFNGDLIVGGGFTSIDGVAANRVARYDGTNWHAMGSGSLGSVTELTVWNSELYARVALTSGVPSISRWSGTNWVPIGNNLFGGDIYRMGDYNGDLIIAGQATSVEGITINGLAKWDGTNWSALGSGLGGPLGPRVLGMLIQDGLVHIAGYFTSVDGVPAANLATWDGTSWTQFGGGADASCYDIRSYNGNIYVTGAFTTIGGVAANGIARWDGAAWHALGSGTDGFGRTLGEYDNRLYVSGGFATAGGMAASYISSWSADVASAAPETRIALNPLAAPNPFGGSTSIYFDVPHGRNVEVDVYDIRGRCVSRLHHGQMPAGRNEVIWNGQDDRGQRQPAGIYFIRAQSGARSTTTKVNLVR